MDHKIICGNKEQVNTALAKALATYRASIREELSTPENIRINRHIYNPGSANLDDFTKLELLTKVKDAQDGTDKWKVDKTKAPISYLDLLTMDQDLISISGVAGSGKSMTLVSVEKELVEDNDPAYIPIYISAKEFNSSGSAMQAILTKISPLLKIPLYTEKDLDKLLNEQGYKFVFLIDGLDETTTTVNDRLETFYRNKLRGTGHKLIFTHRHQVNIPGITKTRLQIKEMTPAMIEEYCQKHGQLEAYAFFKRNHLLAICDNPLLLKLMLEKYAQDKAAKLDPGKDPEALKRYQIPGLLYEDIVKGVLERESEKGKLKYKNKAEQQKAFRYYQNVANQLLAYGNLDKLNLEALGFSPEEVERYNSSIFQDEHFMHRTFLEYFAAVTMQKHWQEIVAIEDKERKDENIQWFFIQYTKNIYRDVLPLFISMLDKDAAGSFLAICRANEIEYFSKDFFLNIVRTFYPRQNTSAKSNTAIVFSEAIDPYVSKHLTFCIHLLDPSLMPAFLSTCSLDTIMKLEYILTGDSSDTKYINISDSTFYLFKGSIDLENEDNYATLAKSLFVHYLQCRDPDLEKQMVELMTPLLSEKVISELMLGFCKMIDFRDDTYFDYQNFNRQKAHSFLRDIYDRYAGTEDVPLYYFIALCLINTKESLEEAQLLLARGRNNILKEYIKRGLDIAILPHTNITMARLITAWLANNMDTLSKVISDIPSSNKLLYPYMFPTDDQIVSGHLDIIFTYLVDHDTLKGQKAKALEGLWLHIDKYPPRFQEYLTLKAKEAIISSNGQDKPSILQSLLSSQAIPLDLIKDLCQDLLSKDPFQLIELLISSGNPTNNLWIIDIINTLRAGGLSAAQKLSLCQIMTQPFKISPNLEPVTISADLVPIADQLLDEIRHSPKAELSAELLKEVAKCSVRLIKNNPLSTIQLHRLLDLIEYMGEPEYFWVSPKVLETYPETIRSLYFQLLTSYFQNIISSSKEPSYKILLLKTPPLYKELIPTYIKILTDHPALHDLLEEIFLKYLLSPELDISELIKIARGTQNVSLNHKLEQLCGNISLDAKGLWNEDNSDMLKDYLLNNNHYHGSSLAELTRTRLAIMPENRHWKFHPDLAEEMLALKQTVSALGLRMEDLEAQVEGIKAGFVELKQSLALTDQKVVQLFQEIGDMQELKTMVQEKLAAMSDPQRKLFEKKVQLFKFFLKKGLGFFLPPTVVELLVLGLPIDETIAGIKDWRKEVGKILKTSQHKDKDLYNSLMVRIYDLAYRLNGTLH